MFGSCNHRLQHPLRTMLSHTHPAIALPPPVNPLPLLPSLLFSLSALVIQNLRPITEALLTRNLRTRTTIRQLSLTPFRGRVRGVCLFDRNDELLLTADTLSFDITRKTLTNIGIAAFGITLHADVNPVNWRDSNWSTHLLAIADMATGEDVIEPQEFVDGKAPAEIQVPKGRCAVSLATQRTAVHIMKPSLTLSLPPLVIPSTDLSSIASIRRLIEGLLGRVARDAGTRSFPRELRTGARRAARDVAVKAIDNIFTDAGRKIGEWRRLVDEAREYVKDVPDIDGAQRVMKDVGGALRSLENLFKGEEELQDTDKGTRKDDIEGFRELDEGDVEE